jgi:hypothetical protein
VAQIRIGEPTLHKSAAELACPTLFTTYRLGCSQIQLDRLGRWLLVKSLMWFV